MKIEIVLIIEQTLDTLFTPNLRRIGRARSNCTDLASLKND